MSERILITPRSLTRAPHAELGRLKQAGYELVYASPSQTPGEDELLDLVPGIVGWIAGVEPISTRVLDRAERLRVISRNGSGVDNVPVEHASQRGIRVERVTGGNARAVAELATTLILDLLRHVAYSNQALKRGDWERRIGIEIVGRTIGIVGCGAIGQEVARIMLALGARVIAYDPIPVTGLAPRGAFRFVTLETLLAEADAITLHCPSPADGQPLIGHKALACMKPGARLVNTARASLVDDNAVLAALEDDRLAGFATDVFDREPPVLGPLLSHERVILTAHIGAYTEESVANVTRLAVDNALAVLDAPHEATGS